VRRGRALLLAALTLGFLAGVVNLLLLRFEAGDVYPPSSSYRTDPFGARAFYEALAEQPGVAVERNLEPLSRVGGSPGTALLLLGEPALAWHAARRHDGSGFETFLRAGGRLVVAFHPIRKRLGASRDGAEPDEREAAPSEKSAWRATSTGFGVTFSFLSLDTAETATSTEVGLPDEIAWKSGLTFARLSPEWRVLYRRGGRPVVIERPFGRGSLLLVADTYLFSNEAMRDDRESPFLARALGPVTRVIFDETHLGVSESPGVAALARRYRLHGVLLAALVVLGLTIWRSAVSFLPPAEDGDESGAVSGKGSLSGFVNLLRRGVKPDELPAVCLSEWERSLGPAPEDVRRELAAGGEPVAVLRRLHERLSRGRHQSTLPVPGPNGPDRKRV